MFILKFLKTKYFLASIFVIVIIVIPFFTYARGLVPCGGEGEDPCNLCFLFKMLENVMNFLVNTVGIVATLFLVIGGIILLISGSNKNLYETGKKIITNTVVGTAIVLTAWILINTILTISGFTRINIGLTGNWFELECSTQPGTISSVLTGERSEETSNEDLSGFVPSNCTPCDESVVPGCDAKVQASASKYGIDPNLERGTMVAETSSARHRILSKEEIDKHKINSSHVTARNNEPSCGLMQLHERWVLKPNGYTCNDVLSKEGALITIDLAAKTLADYLKNDAQPKIGNYTDPKITKDVTLNSMTAARYNDGAKANNKSGDCPNPSQPQWYCDANAGSLAGTKLYALNVKKAAEIYGKCVK